MLLRVLKSNQPFIILLTLILPVLMWLKFLIFNPIQLVPPDASDMPFYYLVEKAIFSTGWSLFAPILAILLLITQAFLIIKLSDTYNILSIRTFLSGILFLLLSCSFVPSQHLQPVLFANVFFIIALDVLFASHSKENTLNIFFNTSLLISIGSLFYFNLSFYFLIIWVALLVMRPFLWREWLVPVLAFITPYFLVSAYYYLILNNLTGFFKILLHNLIVDINFPFKTLQLPYIVLFTFLLLIIALASYKILDMYPNLSISARKYYTIFFWIFALSVLIFLLIPSTSVELLFIAAIPLSFLLSNYFINLKKKWIAEVIFLIYVALIIYIQVVT